MGKRASGSRGTHGAAARAATSPAQPRKDLYSEVTERIIAEMEAGCAPWKRPWRGGAPLNALSRREYQGVNRLLLWIQAIHQGYEDPRWLTFKQAADLGGHVRQGEHGTHIAFWTVREVTEVDPATGDERVVKRIPCPRSWCVFNVQQCEGLQLPALAQREHQPLARCEAIVDAMPQRPQINHGGHRAFYAPKLDLVQMPPRGDFESADGYYGTLFHELAHSTGHSSRLNRPGVVDGGALADQQQYGFEELVAEIAAAFICGDAGILPQRPENEAAYIASWLNVLQNDKRMVLRAAAQAQRAANYILGRVATEIGDSGAGDEAEMLTAA